MSETLIGKAFTNSFSFPGGFVVQADKPIDDRLVVHSVASLTAENTFVSSTDNLLKAYNGMVVSVLETNEIYILTDVANITNINSWKKINVPQASSTDEGKLLTVEKVNVGTTESPVYKYEGRWVDAPSGLPTINGTSDANKILQVNAAGTGVTWVQNTHPKELPTIGASDANKILQVNAGGTGVTWVENTHPRELPIYSSTESGKVLTVSSDGTGTEWSTIDTELVKTVTTNELFTIATQGGLKPGQGSLKPGMKYRITDYNPAVNPDYIVKINGVTTNIATMAPVAMFDIIVTASSESTLFEDVELVAKAGVTTPFDYTKYEAKYDLFGNATAPEPKYDYIQLGSPGVIYYMKDQYGNEASYDFENIVYIGFIPGAILHTFTGVKSGDLRQYGIIQNVRIKNSRETLPGILFQFSSHHVNSTEQVIDVELNNCTNIYISYTSLHHAKISDSNNVSINIVYGDGMNYPLFENLNICNNDNLVISGDAEMLQPFNVLGGFYVNNLNILPSISSRTITLSNIAARILSIFTQGLIDVDVLNKMNVTNPEDAEWTFAVINSSEPPTLMVLGHPRQLIGNAISLPIDMAVYDAILNASKNVKPFDIFNAVDEQGNIIPWSLEIPHFQSTATSVYELGI